MSFDLNVPQILKYSYNIFASAMPLFYLFVGASFGIFVLANLIAIAKDKRTGN